MTKNFWNTIKEKHLNEPFFVVAPMANVTDCAFRALIAKYSKMGNEGGGPAVMWTEFVSCDGLLSEGREILKNDLRFSEAERPIVAQLFTSSPEKMAKCVELVHELGFDGVDINMGCPDRSIEKSGAGASLIKRPELAKEIILAAQKAAGTMPVSVKTRIGYNKDEIDTWIKMLLELKLPALTIHLRTRKELSLVPAHWELMPKIIEMRNKISPETLIIGNGDVKSLDHGKQLARESGVDGLMIGRAIFGNPWLFDSTRKTKTNYFDNYESSEEIKKEEIVERLEVLKEHVELFDQKLKGIKNFDVMKKHFKAYICGFRGAKELRVELMDSKEAKDAVDKIDQFLKTLL